MKYYLVSEQLVHELNLDDCRVRTKENKFIVNQADLISYGLENAKKTGAQEITEEEAKQIIKSLNE